MSIKFVECKCVENTAKEWYCSDCGCGTCDLCGVVGFPRPTVEDEDVWACESCR